MSATNNLNAAITLLLETIAQASKVSTLIAAARAESRDLSDDELAGLEADYGAARSRLVAAIETAKAG